MQQIQVARATNEGARGGAEKIKKQFVGFLNDGILEYRGKPYILINDADYALELQGNRLSVFEIKVVR